MVYPATRIIPISSVPQRQAAAGRPGWRGRRSRSERRGRDAREDDDPEKMTYGTLPDVVSGKHVSGKHRAFLRGSPARAADRDAVDPPRRLDVPPRAAF